MGVYSPGHVAVVNLYLEKTLMVNKKVEPKKTGLKTKKKVTTKASRPPVNTSSPKKNQVKKVAVKKPKPEKPTTNKAENKTLSVKRFNDISFPIVGIGASAGGLEAFEDFFAHLDPHTGMAFVVISHQHPDHNSVLPELLRRCTGMDVIQVTDQLKVKQNTVYLNPPGKQMALFNGTFHVSDPAQPRGLSLPIDFFFRSLAQDQGDKAICIILSGTGTDGTLGLRAIKGESGMAIVQQEASAKFTGMPSSALTTGLVDYMLSPDKMPEQLIRYVQGPFLSPIKSKLEIESLDNIMDKIFLQLRNRTGHDFSKYKANTTRRRIERRMNVHHINNSKDYLKYLQNNPQEGDILFKELLIGVTAFFRDIDAFIYLREKVFPDILKSKLKSNNLTFRLWVAGCASGEEAYSMAILLDECQKEANIKLEIQIFGTDLDPHAIDMARSGLYPSGIAADIPPERLKTYFTKEESSFRINKNIREMVIFAPHNIIKDPPFTKLDLLSCRNLLIYLDQDLQQKVLTLFHYSLLPQGTLFLGNSESLGSCAHLFKPVNTKLKVFTRQPYQPTPLLNKGYFDIPVSSVPCG